MEKKFKHTEIGLIPEDWEVKKLGEIGSFKKGRNIPKTKIQEHGVPCVLYGEIYTKYNFYSEKLISRTSVEVAKSSTEIKKGDILFAGSGETAEDIGKCFTYIGSENAYAGGDVIVFSPEKYNPLFLGFLLNSSTSVKQKSFLGQGSSVFHIYPSNLSKIQIPLPPTKAEQTAIATVLSDTDALIEKLEQLIAKKRLIKQGAMQELLKPKEGWEEKTLDDCTVCLDNLRVPLNETQRLSMKGDFPYCGANGILDYINDYKIDDEIILIAEDGGYFDEYAKRPIAYKMKGKCWVNNHAHILKAKPDFDQDFIFYSLVHKNILTFLASGTRAKLNKSEMYKILIHTPKQKEEQTLIAQILSDMDNEIQELEKQLEKYKMMKQGMMQVLLTGKVRLI